MLPPTNQAQSFPTKQWSSAKQHYFLKSRFDVGSEETFLPLHILFWETFAVQALLEQIAQKQFHLHHWPQTLQPNSLLVVISNLFQ